MDFERVQQNTPTTLSQQWYEDGVATDPGTVTLGITRADGTVLVAPLTATSGTTTNPRTYNLTTTHTATLDRLTVTWTSSTKGTLVSYVEVAGGFAFSIAELRAANPQLADPAKYSTARIADMRTTVEEAIEEWTGALVPRYHRETLSGYGVSAWRGGLRLGKPFLRSVRSITVDGTAVTGSSLTDVTIDSDHLYGYGWPAGYSNITVGYEHGRDRPPERLRRAALLLAKVWLTSGPVDDRTNTFTSTEGGTFSLVTPGRGGSIFGVPEVDAAVMAQRVPAIC